MSSVCVLKISVSVFETFKNEKIEFFYILVGVVKFPLNFRTTHMNLKAEYKTMLRNVKLDSAWSIINSLTNNESMCKVSLNTSVLNTFFTESVGKIRSDIIKPDILPGDFL